jgi:hypothetical protein
MRFRCRDNPRYGRVALLPDRGVPRAKLAVMSAAASVTSHEKYTHSKKTGKTAKVP